MEQTIQHKRIYLIGMMGSGKSHWAGRIGRALGLPAYDLDTLIEEAEHKKIKEIFEQDGKSILERRKRKYCETD